LADGAPVWENKFEVPELDKKFFFLDDDNNFQPSLWHHGLYKSLINLDHQSRNLSNSINMHENYKKYKT